MSFAPQAHHFRPIPLGHAKHFTLEITDSDTATDTSTDTDADSQLMFFSYFFWWGCLLHKQLN